MNGCSSRIIDLLAAQLAILSVLLRLFELVEQRLGERLHDVSELVEDGVLGVVDASILKYQHNVTFEHVALGVLVVLQLLTHALNPHGLLDDCVVVGSLLLSHRLAERPRILMIVQCLQNVVTLFFERLLFGLFGRFVVSLRPAGLDQARDVAELVVDSAALTYVKRSEHSARHQLTNLVQHKLGLRLNLLVYILVVNVFVDLALHHGRAGVLLNITTPPLVRHLNVLREALLSEEFDSVVVSIGCEVLHTDSLRVHLQSIQHERAKAVRPKLRSDRKENNFYEALGREWSEHAAANDLNLSLIIARVRLKRVRQLMLRRAVVFHLGPALPNQDGLMLPVHGQAHDVVSRHPRQLLRDDVFEVDQIAHGAQPLVILDNDKLNLAFVVAADERVSHKLRLLKLFLHVLHLGVVL